MEEYLRYWSILQRRWLPTSIVFLTLLALSIVKTLIETPIYQAGGQLVLKKNSTSTLTGVGNQLGQLESSVSGRPLGTEVAVLRSLPLAEKTINSLDLNINPLVFLKDLEVKNIDNTDILEIYYTSEDPRRAASIVNTLMKIYIDNDINANRAQTRSARDFIAQQLPLRKAALQAAERRLQFFKQQNRVLDLKAEATSSVSILTDLDRQVAATRSDLSSQTARMQSIQKLFGITSQEAVVAGFVGESPSTTSVLGQLQDIQQKIAVTGLRLTDTHPTMIDLKREEAILKVELKKRIEQSFIGKAARLNQTKEPENIVQLRTLGLQQGILGQYASAEAERLSLQVRLKSLAQVIESYRQRANTLPQLELQQRQLEREISATDSSYQALLDRYQELQVAENLQVSNARIVTPALIPAVPIRSRQYINLLQGLIGGIVLGVATAFVLERLDKTIKTPKSAKDLLGYTLLGYVPPFPNGGFTPEVIVRKQPDSPISEAFRMLQTNLRFFNSEQSIKVIVVSSAVPKEGKSTISANLAFSISQLGRNVLLVDADLRHPSQHKIWEIPNEVGLSNVLKRQLDLNLAVTEIVPNLEVITAGEINNNPAALLDSSQMAVFVAQVAQKYDFVIIDTAPLTVAADATILGKLANGILFVVRPGKVDSTSISLSKEMLEKADQNVLGIAMNGINANQQYSAYAVSTV
ncbi:polysaccharide biosynthesis tyrosine autokinase [Sphaerospermopsis aphanizomenoides BCCUSP55]|uniref:GumC family protein n=1 Tax=Sphaerospermopsis aphanizomenoides TaxID=459663 RepID=UPI001904568A|nr:polysaccharide biosynthesis tyrosine autokinase [Sphaerospermopsis aphanizomenoides]MBK1988959.1 polysaccharide biosynthesis tyrosine autokinase [Sphaerospermopsis aphanizomenoides BCCUSP55]